MASILGVGGFGAVPHTATPSAPAVLMDDDVEGSACNAYSVGNLDGTNWLWVRVNHMHPGGAFCVLPGERIPLVDGFNGNALTKIVAWTTLPNQNWSGTQAGSDINVVGGRQRVI